MDPITDHPVEHSCSFCKKPIVAGERRYFSRQAGMKGLYHWECFVQACRQVNKAGATAIEANVVFAGLQDNFYSVDSFESD